jgi:precorrin-6B methylase 2
VTRLVAAPAVCAVLCTALVGTLAACKGEPARAQERPESGGSQATPVDPGPGEQARFDRERRPDLVVAALGIKPGSVVADIGAGTGLLTVHLARAVSPGGKVVATDVDGAVLDLLDNRVAAAGLGRVVERRVVAADSPGLEAGTYDAILLAEVDHYFSDRVAWLRAAIPALKPGGRIVIANRTYHRAPAMAAAAKAGLHLDAESTEVPGQFIATFSVAEPAGSAAPPTVVPTAQEAP